MKRVLVKVMAAVAVAVAICDRAVLAISAEKIGEIVRTADVLAPEYRKKATAAVQGELAAVSVFRNPKANEDDCKIDSILLAKKIMDADPAINRVRLSFYDLQNSGMFWGVEVSRADVQAYATATVGKDVLLGSISLVKQSQTLNLDQLLALGVKKGPLLDARSILFAHIRYLKSKGLSGLEKYLPECQSIERQAESGNDTGLEARIIALDLKVQDEVKRYNQAQATLHAKQVANNQAGVLWGDQHSQENWQRLAPRYPQFVPKTTGSQRDRRMRLALRLMMLSDSGQLGTPETFASQFAALERLAAANDGSLDQRLRMVEMSVGLSILPQGSR